MSDSPLGARPSLLGARLPLLGARLPLLGARLPLLGARLSLLGASGEFFFGSDSFLLPIDSFLPTRLAFLFAGDSLLFTSDLLLFARDSPPSASGSPPSTNGIEGNEFLPLLSVSFPLPSGSHRLTANANRAWTDVNDQGDEHVSGTEKEKHHARRTSGTTSNAPRATCLPYDKRLAIPRQNIDCDCD
ncbi:MAG: hypothetical protein LBJ67_05910 [Planctomycetaceae bacterium]|nr:hypothetical protein [Planctomycetaceae bacterium]